MLAWSLGSNSHSFYLRLPAPIPRGAAYTTALGADKLPTSRALSRRTRMYDVLPTTRALYLRARMLVVSATTQAPMQAPMPLVLMLDEMPMVRALLRRALMLDVLPTVQALSRRCVTWRTMSCLLSGAPARCLGARWVAYCRALLGKVRSDTIQHSSLQQLPLLLSVLCGFCIRAAP